MIRSEPGDGRVVERQVVIGGVRTRVLEVAGSGPPFLLLHGFSDSADTWRPMLRELAQRGRAGVAVDLPGHGRADPPRAWRPVIPQLVEFAGAAAEWAGDRPVVVGNSLGGLIALLLAERCERLGGAVPVDPAGFDYAPWMWALARLMGGRVVPLALTSSVLVPTWIVRHVVQRGIRRSFGRPSEDQGRFAVDYAGHVSSRAALRRMIGMLRLLAVEGAAPLLRPADVTCPVMLIWGSRDPVTPSDAALLLVDALPGVRYEELAGAGHMPQLEQPRRIAALLDDFAPAPS